MVSVVTVWSGWKGLGFSGMVLQVRVLLISWQTPLHGWECYGNDASSFPIGSLSHRMQNTSSLVRAGSESSIVTGSLALPDVVDGMV